MMRFFVLFLCSLVFVSTAQAATFVRFSDQFELEQGQDIAGNFLTAGTPVRISGDVAGDVTALGNEVVTSGVVGGDVLAAAVLLQQNGEIQGDMRVLVGSATIAGEITGDLLVLGGSVDILSTATIGGDVFLRVSEATIAGAVGGSILGSAEQLAIAAPVAGSIDVSTEQLSLMQGAAVAESVRYASENLLVQSLDASVSGAVVRVDPVQSTASVMWLPVVMLSFVALLWFFLSRRTLLMTVSAGRVDMGSNVAVGVGVLLLLPVTLLVLAFSTVGLLVGLLLLAACVVLWVLASAAVLFLLGRVVLSFVALAEPDDEESLTLYQGLIGSLLFAGLLLVPVVGGVLYVLCVCVVLGALVRRLVAFAR